MSMVRNIYFLFLAFLVSIGNAASSPLQQAKNLETLVSGILPVALRGVKPGYTTRDDLEKLLGAALKGSKASVRYYLISGRDKDANDLTVELQSNQVVRYFYYRLPQEPKINRLKMSTLKPFFSKAVLELAQQEVEKNSHRSDAGRTLDVTLLDKGVLLRFEQSESPTLSSVLMWQPGEKMP